MRPLCLYHKNCLDGSAAAAVVARKDPEAELKPVQYGMPVPSVEGRRVYVVDFGWNADAMRALRAQATELFWLDHHASQEPVWKTLGWGVFDTNECGATLAWNTLFPDQPPPPVLAYIRDKDLWQWRLDDSRAICAGLAEAFSGSKVEGLLEVNLAAMAERGRPLLAAQRIRIEAAARTGVPMADALGVRGLNALAVPCFQDQNELGEFICQPTAEGGLGFDLAILFHVKTNGGWVHSLRSRVASVDCATLAAKRGGGGHLTSGCFIAQEPIVPLI